MLSRRFISLACNGVIITALVGASLEAAFEYCDRTFSFANCPPDPTSPICGPGDVCTPVPPPPGGIGNLCLKTPWPSIGCTPCFPCQGTCITGAVCVAPPPPTCCL